MKTLIIDDEQKAITNLQTIVENLQDEIEIVGTANNIEDATKLINQKNPDFIFLDIDMPGGSGFDLLKNFSNDRSFDVVFVTAFDDYAINAFKVSAIDFLVKPVMIEDIQEAIEKVKRRRKNKSISTQIYDNLLHNLDKNQSNILTIINKDKVSFVPVEEIVRLKGEGSYAEIITEDEKHLSSKPLKEYESCLVKNNFFRVHQSHMINLYFIDKYIRTDGGYILMKNGDNVPISRKFKEFFMDELKKFS